jgi:hypothetical protein
LNDHKAQCSLNATIKKDKEASELTSILLEVDAAKIKDNHTQFSIGASLEGGFLSSFLETPYKRVVKAFTQHPISWKIALKGLLKASSEIDAHGEMVLESSTMKHHAQFSFTERVLKVDHAHIELSFMPTALFPQLGGSLCTLNATLNDIVIPLTTEYSELVNTAVIDSSLSLTIPSLTCNGKKILNDTELFVSFIKDPKDPHIRLQLEETAQVPVQYAICDLVGFIPDHTSIKTSYQMMTKDFSLDAHIHGNDYKFQSHVDGLCDIENKELMITTPWAFSFLINKKESLFRCLPFSFQSLNVNGTPLHISFQDDKVDFKKDTTIRCDILGAFSEKMPSFDTSMICTFDASKGIVDMQIKASDSDKKDILSASVRIDKKWSLSSHVDLFPSLIPYLTAYQKLPSLYENFQGAQADITIKDMRQPFLDGKASVTYTSSLLQANGILSCKNGIFQLKKQDEKTPLFRLVVTDESLQKIKQLCGLNNSLHFLSPLSFTIPLCSLKAQYDQDLKKFTSLDGDFLLSSDPVFAQVNKQEYSLVGTTLSAHIDNEKKATCTIRPSPSLKTQAKTSVSGDCTIEYQEAVHMLTLENTKIKASVEVQDIPADVLRALSSKGDSVAEILTPFFSFDLHFTSDKTKEGIFQFHLKAQNASCSLDSAEIKNGILSFSSPLLLKLVLDKKRGSELLKNIIPFLSSGLTKPHEISIEISPENTFIPIKNWSLQATSIPKITLTIGKVEVKRTGLLETILKTLRVSSKKSASLWFTPIHASLQNGAVTLERFDMQASDSIHLIVWGKANLINSSLGMYTAIPEDTFKRLGLYLSIPRPLILPIRGTFDEPEINMIKFTARMAGAGASTYGALEGALGIVGGALQIASTLGDEDVPIPPPLELPFPWDK